MAIEPERPDLDILRAELEEQPWADNREYTIWLIDMVEGAAKVINKIKLNFLARKWLARFRGDND